MEYNRAKNYFFPLILVLIIFLSNSFLAFCTSSFRMGFPAPDFVLNTLDGETFHLQDYKNKQKLTILYFCNHEQEDSICGLEDFEKYFKEYIAEEKYQIVLINTFKDFKEKDFNLIKEFFDNKEINFTLLIDKQNEVAKLYNIEKLPTAILLDQNLVVKKVYSGLLSKQQTTMFRYITYFLDAEKKLSEKKENKENDGCNGGVCPPPPGY